MANRILFSDCDEVYNYWDPLHHVLYGGGEGSSMQTWEYAHEYALRTYAYLLPLVGLSKLYQVLIPYLPAWIWPLLSNHQVVVSAQAEAEAIWMT